MINDENKFNLIQKPPITPEQINNIDINELSSTNNISAINLIINDLCNEEFEKNKNFQFTNEELKIIKNYQILTQCMVQSINKLTRKSEADSIILGTHGKTGLKSTLLGSFAQNVIKTIDLPITLIK